MPRIHLSNILTAFDNKTVGTRVLAKDGFLSCLQDKLANFHFPSTQQGLVAMDDFLVSHPMAVMAGVTKRSSIPQDGYVIRRHRGEDLMFANRAYSVPPDSLVAVVYTAAAYCTDPQVDAAECKRIYDYPGFEHDRDVVLVAILASVGPKSPLSSARFVRNLAGGNRAYSPEAWYTIEHAVSEARDIERYEQNWIGVAD